MPTSKRTLLGNQGSKNHTAVQISRHITRFRGLKLDWRMLQPVDILILFDDTSEQLSSYFPTSKIAVVDLESKRRNVWVILRTVLRGNFKIDGYLRELISVTKPRLILTAQDNFEPFWRLKRQRSACLALVQNGLRTADLNTTPLGNGDGNSLVPVEYYFCFGQPMVEFLSSRMRANLVPIGSFRSNHVPKVPRDETSIVSYISTYRSDVSHSHLLHVKPDGRGVTYGDILQSRLELLSVVLGFCRTRQLQFRIIGKDLNHEAELDFYRRRLPQSEFEFVPRHEGQFQYESCDRSSLVVSTGSTLGLESLSRGNRTAILNNMSVLLGEPSQSFGWPVPLDPEGPFWSSRCSDQDVLRVLGRLHAMNDGEWFSIRRQYQDVLPVYDPQNSLFVQSLRDFGAQTPSPKLETERR